MIAIDTNLLVYAHRVSAAEHTAARQAIQSAASDPRGWGIALPCVAEFWSVVTHPAAKGGPSSGRQAAGFLESVIVGAGARMWLPADGFWTRLARLASSLAIQGARVFDLQIALMAFENGASEIWTQDRGFTPLPGLTIHHPL